VWLYGSTGTRKSSFATAYAEETKRQYFMTPPMSSTKETKLWFHGLTNQEVSILDDCRSASLPLPLFLRLADKWGCSLEIKGAHAAFMSRILFVTAPTPPWEFWSDGSSELSQGIRRIACVVRFTRCERSGAGVLPVSPLEFQSNVGLVNGPIPGDAWIHWAKTMAKHE